ncbi:MAG TPA: single-stranded DNA-binding protein [Candidatus Dormibacteraeota bacterium]|nr:single-stranded DNA-binding protein [Candidatus Dormibacteraeota bacterium]
MVNRVILVGNLAADPEVRATPKGTYVANMRLATHSYVGKDDEGNRKEQTEFHHLVAFGKMAEFAGQYLHKGRLVSAQGRLQTRSWEDTAGQKRYRTEVLVEELQPLGPKPQEAAA